MSWIKCRGQNIVVKMSWSKYCDQNENFQKKTEIGFMITYSEAVNRGKSKEAPRAVNNWLRIFNCEILKKKNQKLAS